MRYVIILVIVAVLLFAALLTLEPAQLRSYSLLAGAFDTTEEPMTAPSAAVPPPPEPASPIAHVNGVPINAHAVRTEMVSHGADFLSRFEKLEEKEAVVEELVRIQVLAQTARQVGFDDDPGVRDAINRLLAERYWHDLMSRLELLPITEDEARAFYEANPDRYTETLRARGAMIQLRVPRDASRTERKKLRADAERILAEATGASDQHFAALAQQYSDDLTTRERGGDMGFIAQGMSVFPYAAPVIEALFSIDETGGVAPVVETERAFSIVRLTTRSGGELAPFPAMLPNIRRHLQDTRRRAKQAERYTALRSGFDVAIDLDMLETIGPQDLAAKSRPPAFPVGVKSQ